MTEQLPFTSSRFQELVVNYKKKSFTILGAFLILIIGLGWFINKNNKKRVQNIQEAEVCVQEIRIFDSEYPKNDKTIDQLVNELQTLANKNSTIKRRYDGVLGQELMFKDSNSDPQNIKIVQQYAKNCENRLEKADLPLFATFTKISVLTEAKQYEEARKQAILLKEKLKSTVSNPVVSNLALYVATLLQIVTLEKALNLKSEYEKSLKELVTFISSQGEDKFSLLLQEGSHSLTDFFKNSNFQ